MSLPALPRTVALFLGPYRNLTTLTASILHLHPNCQVLNHGGNRILHDPALNFLADGRRTTFARFCSYALTASEGGRRGWDGGSIALSHAFDRVSLRDAYRRRFGDSTSKDRVDCLVWKESLLVAQELRRTSVDLEEMLARLPRLRFLLPIRNPLDCAVSNVRSGHAALLTQSTDTFAVLEAILRELAWFRRLERAHPRNFLSFFEFEVDPDLLARLSAFLELTPDGTWLADALACFDVGGRYEHDHASVQVYLDLLGRCFPDDEEALRRLERFAPARRAPVAP